MKLLVSTMPATGHVHPFQRLAAELVKRGHEVVWITGESFRAKVEVTGAKFAPMKKTADFAQIPVGPDEGSSGLSAAVSVMRRLFVDRIEGQVADYREILEGLSADALVVDLCSLGAHTLRALGGPVYCTLGITPLVTFDPEIPPWGAGTMPPKTLAGRLWNQLSHIMGKNLFMPKVTALVNEVRVRLGLDALPKGVEFHDITRSPYLHLMPTTLAFEYPRSNLEPQIHFVGPLLPIFGDPFTLPPWWSELKDNAVVHVTQGSYATDSANLIRPTIQALRDLENVLVVVTTPDADVSFPKDSLPSNVRLAKFIPHSALLPQVKVLVTNAGYNGVLAALSYGIPMVCAGRTEDKADVSARVAWSGAGIDLRTDKPSEKQILNAVNSVLNSPKFAENALRIKVDFERHNSAVEACELLENLVEVRAKTIRD